MTSSVSLHVYIFCMNQQYYIYILASRRNGTLYIGSTSDLKARVFQHKNKLVDGFSNKYNVTSLVYYEITNSRISAIHRERQLKEWHRKWKIRIIEEFNPDWDDLYSRL